MGFTPLDGLMMGTRSGSVDPGILIFLMRQHGLDADQIDDMLNKKSGLLGISGLSGDMRDILAGMRAGNGRAKLAFDLYTYGLRTTIGKMAAALEGLDVLVFTAGVGENSPEVRAATCKGLEFLGVTINLNRNQESLLDRDISSADSRARVLVIRAAEDWAIAGECWELCSLSRPRWPNRARVRHCRRQTLSALRIFRENSRSPNQDHDIGEWTHACELETKQAEKQLSGSRVSPLAGKPAPREMLVDLEKLEREYFERKPNLEDPEQLVAFGTSGHRGTSLNGTFTEAHVLAITQAICDYRKAQGTTGPLYMGKDTHALSSPAQCSALEVLAANNVETMIQKDDGVTPTPVISHAILVYNRTRQGCLGGRHRHHTFPQSSGRRWFQVQPAQRRPCGY